MTPFQKIVKYIATALAIALSVSIISGILGVAALFTGLSNADATADNLKTYSVSQSVKNIEIDVNAANISFKKGDTLSIESNLNKLSVTEKNGTLKVKEKRLPGIFYGSAVLTVTIPENSSFEKLSINSAAGVIEIDSLNITKKAVIDSGIAKISVNAGSYNDLDIDSGIGSLVFNGKVTGKCEINAGIGDSDITILGKKSDYSIDIDKGIGSITVDGEKITDFESSEGDLGKIEIDGGIGSIELNFK